MKTFATFGSTHLEDFNVNPLQVYLVHEDESELRGILQKPPFNNRYFTTYPIKELERMVNVYGGKSYTLDELLALQGRDEIHKLAQELEDSYKELHKLLISIVTPETEGKVIAKFKANIKQNKLMLSIGGMFPHV